MTREEKGKVIDELAEKFSANSHFYLTNASGLTVEQVNALRKLCFHAGVEYKVYKNTLIRKALEKESGKYDALFDSLKGFSGIMFSKEAGNTPAKVIKEFRKKMEGKPLLKAASIDLSFYIGDQQLDALANLKSKKELLGEIIGLLQSPPKNVLSALLSSQHTVAGILKTLEQRKQ